MTGVQTCALPIWGVLDRVEHALNTHLFIQLIDAVEVFDIRRFLARITVAQRKNGIDKKIAEMRMIDQIILLQDLQDLFLGSVFRDRDACFGVAPH